MSTDEIYSIGYRSPDQSQASRSPIDPIARTVLGTAFAKRTAKVLAAFGLGVFLIHAVWLVAVILVKKVAGGSDAQSAAIIGSANEIVTTFLWVQYFVAAVLVAAIMPGCVADDRQARCWIVYFSRPLSRRDYALGKLVGVFIVPCLGLVAPTALLSLVAFGISPPGARPGLLTLFVPATAISILGAMALTTTMVGLSARTDNSRSAGTFFAGAIFGLPLLVGSLSAVGVRFAGYIDPARNLRTLAHGWLDPSRSVAGDLVTRVEANGSVVLSLVAIGLFCMIGLDEMCRELHGDIDV